MTGRAARRKPAGAFATTSRGLGAVLLCAAALAPGFASAQEAQGRAASERHTRIVGGAETEPGAYPWQVALVEAPEAGSGQFCGGSVIAPRWVLTAGHCVDGAAPGDLQALVGAHNLDEDGRRIDVAEIRLHENYTTEDGPPENDIALLRLAEAAGAPAVRLPDAALSADLAAPGAMATVVGWGLLRPLRCAAGAREGAHRCNPRGGGDGHFVDDLTGGPVDLADVRTSRLMAVELPLVGEAACRDAYSADVIDSRVLCAGLRGGGKDSCQGDSGGPLVARDGASWVQLGVVSWGAGCAKPGKYGVYASTGAYAAWITDTAGLEAAAAAPEPAPVGDAEETATGGSVENAPPPGDRALVIGIDLYADPAFPDLKGAARDARNMRALLTDFLGFELAAVRMLTDRDATRAAILDGVRRWLVAGTRPGDRALLYFAGHGYFQPDEDGDEEDGYDEALAPHDVRLIANGDPMTLDNHILDDEIGALFARLRDRQAYLIVDSCHSGTVTRTLDPAAGGRLLRLAVPDSPGATRAGPGPAARAFTGDDSGFISTEDGPVAWTAVSPSQIAFEDLEVDAEERHGFFTGRFVRGIAERRADADGDGRVLHAELLDYLRAESKAYCERLGERCKHGLTPYLEGPPDILMRDLRDLAVVAAPSPDAPDPPAAAAADAALGGHGNAAVVRIEMLPTARLRVGDEVAYRVRSERSGHLLLVDVDADGKVTQLFPNRWSERAGKGARIEAGRPVVVPNAFYGFRFTAGAPTGSGTTFAVVTEDPVALDDLLAPNRDLEPVAGGRDWLLALGARLREPWTDSNGVREPRWSFDRVDYEIAP